MSFEDKNADIGAPINRVIKDRQIVRGKLIIPKLTVHIFCKTLWMFMSKQLRVFEFKKPNPYLLTCAVESALKRNSIVSLEFRTMMRYIVAEKIPKFPQDVDETTLQKIFVYFVRYFGRCITSERIKIVSELKKEKKKRKRK